MRPTQRLIVGMAAGPSLLALALLAVLQVGCPHNPGPAPTPVTPDASDAARPAPVVNPEPGPVPSGDLTKCSAACRHVDDACPGALNACVRACTRSGGADLGLIPCLNGVQDCGGLRACDPLARAAAP